MEEVVAFSDVRTYEFESKSAGGCRGHFKGENVNDSWAAGNQRVTAFQLPADTRACGELGRLDRHAVGAGQGGEFNEGVQPPTERNARRGEALRFDPNQQNRGL